MSYHLKNGIKFMQDLPAKSVDGIFTDPPWGGQNAPKIKGQRIWKHLLRRLDKEAVRILKPSGYCLIWVGTAMLGDLLKTISKLKYQWCIYELHIPSRYVAGYECRVDPIVCFRRREAKFPMQGSDGKKIDQLYQQVSNGIAGKVTKHPCAREIKTVRCILKKFFIPGQYIIDPFAGSDTVGVVCRQLNLTYDTCEIDPKMYDYGLKRNSQMFLYEDIK